MFLEKIKSLIKATGEMSKDELEKGGEWYEIRVELEHVAKSAGLKAKVKPFDQYQGPFAELTLGSRYLGDLWCIQYNAFGPEDKWFFKPSGELRSKGQKDFEGNFDKMVKHLKELAPELKVVPGGKPSWLPQSDFSKRPNLKLIKSMVEKYLR